MLYISVSFPDDKASRIASLCTWRRFSRSSSARRSSSVLHHELPPVRSWPDASYRSQRLLPLHWWRSRLVNVVAVLLEATASSVSPTTIARFLRQRWQVMRANCWRGMATSTGHLPPAGLRKKNDEENVDHKLDSPVDFFPPADLLRARSVGQAATGPYTAGARPTSPFNGFVGSRQGRSAFTAGPRGRCNPRGGPRLHRSCCSVAPTNTRQSAGANQRGATSRPSMPVPFKRTNTGNLSQKIRQALHLAAPCFGTCPRHNVLPFE